MKRNLILLVALIACSSFAFGQEFHVGFRAGFPSLIGVQASVRFPVAPTGVFESRVVLGGVSLSWLVFSLDALYHFRAELGDSDFYLGLGAGSWTTDFFYACPAEPGSSCPAAQTYLQIHPVIGFEVSLSEHFMVFFETAPIVVYFTNFGTRLFIFDVLTIGILYKL